MSPCQQDISQISLPSSASMLVTFFTLAKPQRHYSTFSGSLPGLQTGQAGARALLPDDMRYVNADFQGGPSSLFLCLSLGSWRPRGPKNLLCPLTGQQKRLVLYGSLNLFAEMCCCACQSLDPLLMLAFFFLWESNESPFYVPGDQEAERCWHVPVRIQPRVLISEFPCFSMVCVTHGLYIKVLALAERNPGRLIKQTFSYCGLQDLSGPQGTHKWYRSLG